MLSVIVERGIFKKVKNFSGAAIDGKYNYVKPLLKKYPDNILHVRANNNTVTK